MENKQQDNLTVEQKAKLREKKAQDIKKRKAQAEVRRKYFDYYDDVKTNIKEDW